MPAVAVNIPSTHADRTPTRQGILHLRIIPGSFSGRVLSELEYDAWTPRCDGSMAMICNRITIEEPAKGLYHEPLHHLSYHVVNLMSDFRIMESQVNGLKKQIDELTTEKIILSGKVESLENSLVKQASEWKRQLEDKKKLRS